MSLIDSVARAIPTPTPIPFPIASTDGAPPPSPGPAASYEPGAESGSADVYVNPSRVSLAGERTDSASFGTATADVQAISAQTAVAPVQDPAQVVAQAAYGMVTDLLSRPVDVPSRLKFA